MYQILILTFELLDFIQICLNFDWFLGNETKTKKQESICRKGQGI